MVDKVSRYPIQKWMRLKDTIDFIGLWEILNNENFNHVEFDTFKMESGNIHSAYIAEIKRKYGVDMQSLRTIDDAKHVNCPKEKADVIIDALKHFNII